MKTVVLSMSLVMILCFVDSAAAKQVPPPSLDHLPLQNPCAHVEKIVREKGTIDAAVFVRLSTRNEDKACSIVLAHVELALNNNARAREWFGYALIFVQHEWWRIRAEALYYKYKIALSDEINLEEVKELRQLAPKAAKQLGF